MTHTGKRADGTNGCKSVEDLILLEQKGPESVENQGLEGSQSVGKDEVSGSNPDSSSKKSSNFSYERLKLELFLCKKLELVVT